MPDDLLPPMDPQAMAGEVAPALPPEPEDKWDGPSDEDILDSAKERYKYATDYWSDWRQTAEKQLTFAEGEQWPEKVKREREAKGRPCLTIDRSQSFIKQVTNEQRQNRPQIKYSPAEDGPDQQAADTMTGLARQIQVASNADTAIDTAFYHAALIGRGWYGLITDYVSPDGFEQEARFRRFLNPFACTSDPLAREPDGSDLRFFFVESRRDRKEFDKEFPKASKEAFGDGSDVENGWWDDDEVREVEYYWIDTKPVTLYLLADQTTTTELLPGANAIRKRKSEKKVVRWAKLTAANVLEKTTVLGEYIPMFPVYGDESDNGKKLKYSGLMRVLMDPQVQHNAMQSAQTERVQLAPKAPFTGPAEGVAGHEAAWADAATSNDNFLPYNHKDADGEPLPAPQRQQAIDISPGIQAAIAQSIEDMKAVTGIFDASLGNRSNEQSGRAILQRQKQSGTANFHYQDNLRRSLRHCGRVLADWIPKLYTEGQQVRILGEDGKSEFRTLTPNVLRSKYDIVASVGPSYETKRQEAAQTATDLSQNFPQLMEAAGDLIVSQTDMPLAGMIAKRLKKMLPPGLAEPEPGEESPLPPQVQQQIQQLDQTVQAMSAHLEQLESGEAIKREEIASRERIEAMKVEAQLAIAEMKTRSDEGVEALRIELQHMRERTLTEPPGGVATPPAGPDGPGAEQPESLEAPPSAGFSMPDGAQGPSPAGVSGEPVSQPPDPSASL